MQRDADAFTEFYRENYGRIVAYVRRRSTADPHVIASGVFTAAWQRYDQAQRGGLPWLYRTAHFELRNAQRTANRRRGLESKVAETGEKDVSDPMGSVVDRIWVGRVLRQLSESDQELLMLLYWEDLDYRSAGTALGCSAGAIAVRAHRARKRFARLVAETPTQEATSQQRSSSSPHPEASSS